MKIWISKYALSRGITEHECSEFERGCVYPGDPFMSYVGFKLGSEAHVTREAAIEAAEKARKKRIDNLRKQIAGLEKMRFREEGQ